MLRRRHIADDLKASFIDFVLNNFDSDVIIGHEVMYGSNGKIADIILLYKGFTYAVEIKSDNDTLYRLDSQINEYQKLFNYVIVVCGEKYFKKLSSSLPKNVGLYLVTNSSNIKEHRRPSKKIRLDKEEMLYTIKTSYLSHIADFPTCKIGSDTLRLKFAKKRISCIQEILYEYWVARMKPSYENFLSDRGDCTIATDLSNFAMYRVLSTF